MYGGQSSVPIVIRMVVGRGWGQGPQHSQSFHNWFAHVPGLKVILPSTSHDAKGMLIAAIEDNNPVICIEHRWLMNLTGPVPEGIYREPIGKSIILQEGEDLTFATSSYMTLEAVRAAEALAQDGISAEVVDIRTVNPFDKQPVIDSVKKTGHLIAGDIGTLTAGFSSEIIASVCEQAHSSLKSAPQRVALPDLPYPTSPALAGEYLPRSVHLVAAARRALGLKVNESIFEVPEGRTLDQPDPSFTGPF
jgi:pyruvate dehydrogenase E1 component beta subunit